ncbi:MAG TPA: ATP--guanido phosphotransferase [bacterium]|nr:ATP--guanido phosphotransferase [bacterium]HOL34585.1 ATP--guanido phosphotransferase [bacterium]
MKNLVLKEPVLSEEPTFFTVRLRLARNIKKYPFPHQMNEKQAEQLVKEVIDVSTCIADETPVIVSMTDIDHVTRNVLIERHIISPEMAEHGFGKILIWFPQMRLRIFVNEEDHLRIAVYGGKENFYNLWDRLNHVDDILSRHFDYAFDREFGYLTCCPTNVGPALRVSSLIYLPALKMTGKIKLVFGVISQIGCIIRGFYGEGSKSIADVYQIATGPALGKQEIELCQDFESVCRTIRKYELMSMGTIDRVAIKRKIVCFLDRIFENEKGISSSNSIKGLSLLLFGKNLGIINVDAMALKRLFYRILPASLQLESATEMDAVQRDSLRLNILRNELRNVYV